MRYTMLRLRHRDWCPILVTLLALSTLFVFDTFPIVNAAKKDEAKPAAADDEDGFKPLFNGKDLTGWDGNPAFWSVKEGVVTAQTTAENPTKGNTFLIWKDGKLDDFELRLSYKIIGGNSGIQYRSKDMGNWVVGGYQADFEAGDTYSGILYEERGRGILAQRGTKVVIQDDGKKEVVEKIGDSKELQAAIKKEDWNDYRIIAKGNHLIHMINGNVTIDVTDHEEAKRAMSGILALQLHAGPPMVVQFKDVRLKRLKLNAANSKQDRKKVVLVAGTPSHAPLHHEFNAGVQILEKCLNGVPGILATSYLNGWPRDVTAFDNADSILLYMDGGSGHPLIRDDHLLQMAKLMKKGVGLACVHYAVEIPADRGGPELLEWIGGYYERDYSINPHWVAEIVELPKHPVTNGVRPFTINDEWYFNMRFPVDPKYTAILKAIPPDDVRRTAASKEFPGRNEVLAWAVEREDGGRGFGFTGGHFHLNWGDENFRRLVLNALFWTAHGDVPQSGIESSVTEEELQQNLDPKNPKK